MKHLLYLFALWGIMAACGQQKEATQSADTQDEKTAHNSQNQFRRFTYFFQTDREQVKAFFDSEEWKQISEKALSDQIFDLKLYRKESDHFLLVDAAPEMNAESLLELLKREDAFEALSETLKINGVSAEAFNQPLERIYKLEQQVAYSPAEGQLKSNIGPYKRFVWTLLLQEDPELMAEYRRVHGMGMAWPEITSNMKSIGVKDMEIYLHDTQAILIMDTRPDFDLEEVGPKWQKLPREEEWQAYVAKFQRTDPESSIQEKWQDMKDLTTN
ncbi:MAG: L-rhamnose mutarotase [Bacteroidota bacterium]